MQFFELGYCGGRGLLDDDVFLPAEDYFCLLVVQRVWRRYVHRLDIAIVCQGLKGGVDGSHVKFCTEVFGCFRFAGVHGCELPFAGGLRRVYERRCYPACADAPKIDHGGLC